jgi:hypothetical protein
MRISPAVADHERDPVRASELVMRLAVILGVASAVTFAAIVLTGIDSRWALVALGEAVLSLTLLTQV